jgi:osmotically inducible protein OsmC
MPDRAATTTWSGPLSGGSGTISLESSGAGRFPFSLATRAGEPEGETGPEEMIAAAHSACYSMQLSALLTGAGTPPDALDTRAVVTQQQQGAAFPITGIALSVRATVPGCDEESFQVAAEEAKRTCPVSVALSGTEITVHAHLQNTTATG